MVYKAISRIHTSVDMSLSSSFVLHHLHADDHYIEPLDLIHHQVGEFEEVPEWAWPQTRFYTYYWYHDTHDYKYCTTCVSNTFPDFNHIAYNYGATVQYADSIDFEDFDICELCDKICIIGIQDAELEEVYDLGEDYCLAVKQIAKIVAEE